MKKKATLVKFTFKKTVHEGRFKSFQTEHHTVKLNGKEIGIITELDLTRYGVIDASGNDGKFEIRICVKREPAKITKQSPCEFKWCIIKQKFDSAELARKFIVDNSIFFSSLDIFTR